jgi:hypothetical protein
MLIKPIEAIVMKSRPMIGAKEIYDIISGEKSYLEVRREVEEEQKELEKWAYKRKVIEGGDLKGYGNFLDVRI